MSTALPRASYMYIKRRQNAKHQRIKYQVLCILSYYKLLYLQSKFNTSAFTMTWLRKLLVEHIIPICIKINARAIGFRFPSIITLLYDFKDYILCTHRSSNVVDEIIIKAQYLILLSIELQTTYYVVYIIYTTQSKHTHIHEHNTLIHNIK